MTAPDLPETTLMALDRAHVWHPYASLSAPTPVYPVVGARGVRLQLADGRELVDGTSSWWSAVHGYNHPVLNAALRDQLDRMANVMFGGLTHPAAVKLCALLAKLTPAPLSRVFLSDSGSVAVEVAVKMALQYWREQGRPERSRLLTVAGGYHGDTFMAMSLCDPDEGMHHLFGANLPRHHFAPRPRPRFGEPCADDDLAELAALLEHHGGEIAGVILEPIVQAAGGLHFYSADYLRRLRALCDEHDVLLICDEIATGFGRTGRLFACEHAGISPDILCLGKAVTGGYLPLAATLCTDRVALGLGALMHGPTFMGNALASAVACASVELLVSQPWQRQVEAIEARLRVGLEPARGLPGVADVRVLGAIGVIEMERAVDVPALQQFFVDRGLWVRPFGRLIYTMPPFVIGAEDLDAITAGMVAGAARAGERGVIATLDIAVPGPGLHAFTSQVADLVARAGQDEGLCTLFIQHTSASLLVQENYDPSARRDLERWLARLVPEHDPLYTHTDEGPDDMPAHIRAALTATSLSIPILAGALALGTWQGIYLWEHRRGPARRRVVVHIGG